ncbi:NAD(P)-dependent alcohol dehydrogenase [Nonomuraea mesophila]|uniref:NAD(P)-dependent alcohol dehydrogenase n=1 Tax=Nonomuraea mesophila TaxID=2530382 RepID=A0A4R5FNV6_9ACTN|nr:NAD(P)-dependent alcohol dehydrogenase [Nonomuraea mesophila]TDE54685.1 NAD(P)-dependent alcohol dehydrogenase [Nonomuraea mesophila]
MKAAVRLRYGPPDVVGVTEIDKPTVKPDELLIKVHATTVNRTDCALRAAKPFLWRFFAGFLRPRMRVLGNEFAGEIEAVGGEVTAYKAGERVFGYNDATFGAHAAYMTVSEKGTLATIPAGLSYEEAAPSTEGSHYALSIITAARIREGHDVLVYGATGAIGSAAVQLLKTLGAVVTAVCDTQTMELVRGLGADRVIDRTTTDFTRDPGRYDVVIDAVGKSTFGRCRRLLKPRGVYAASDVGPMWQNVFLALVTRPLGGRRVLIPLPKHDRDTALRFRDLIESGRFRPVIDRRYPLADIVEAHRYVDSGQKIGNVVITIDHPG